MPGPELIYTVCGGWNGESGPEGTEMQRALTCAGEDVGLDSPVIGKVRGAAGCSLIVETLPPLDGPCRFEVHLKRSGAPVESRALDLPSSCET